MCKFAHPFVPPERGLVKVYVDRLFAQRLLIAFDLVVHSAVRYESGAPFCIPLRLGGTCARLMADSAETDNHSESIARKGHQAIRPS
jgi:hypothetical protein